MGGGGKEESYIQDGLAFWLDGINRGTSDTKKWIDLVGGYEFVTADDNDATWGANHLITPCSMICADFKEISHSNSTFEIVFQENAGSINTILYMSRKRDGYNTSDSFGFGKYNTLYMLSNYSSGKLTMSYNDAPFGDTNYCFSFNGDKLIVVNGSTKSPTSYDMYSPSDKTKIATRGNGGKLFCIRQYNRNLTQEEIIHNQQVDNARFKLGLNIT